MEDEGNDMEAGMRKGDDGDGDDRNVRIRMRVRTRWVWNKSNYKENGTYWKQLTRRKR